MAFFTRIIMKRNPIPAATAPGRNHFPPLNPVEQETIQLFVQLARVLGQRPSFAEIYGLLFVSPRPLPQDDFIKRLNLSKGSASQGISFLLELGGGANGGGGGPAGALRGGGGTAQSRQPVSAPAGAG